LKGLFRLGSPEKSSHSVLLYFRKEDLISQHLVEMSLNPRLWESDCDANNWCWGHEQIYKLLKLLRTLTHSGFTKLLRWPPVSDKLGWRQCPSPETKVENIS